MHIGIFSRTFTQPTLAGILDAVAAHGLSHVHFNMKAAGVPNLPDKIDDSLCGEIREAFAARGLTMTSLSATFNAIHPDPQQREHDTRRACELIGRARDLGTSLISLCTGTRDPNDMWKLHLDNQANDAWKDLVETLGRLLLVAEDCGVTLGVEPETNNVIDSAPKARRLLDEMRSPNLKIIMDGANLFHEGQTSHMPEILREAFSLLAGDMVMAHAKDIADPATYGSQAAGLGKLDWDRYFSLLREHGFDGPVVLHNLTEPEVDRSVSFVKDRLAYAYR